MIINYFPGELFELNDRLLLVLYDDGIVKGDVNGLFSSVSVVSDTAMCFVV